MARITQNSMRIARGSSEGQQSVALSTSSAVSTNDIGADSVVVYTDVECFLVAGETPVATVAAGTPMPAGATYRLTGLLATDKIAAITAAGTGTLYIRPDA